MGKLLVGIFSLVVLVAGLNAHAIFPQDTKNQNLLTLANVRDPYPGIGSIVNWTKNMLRVTYDFSVLGGTATTVGLLDDQGNAAFLPKGAIVTNVVMNVLTQPLPSTSSVNLTMLTAGDLMATKPQSSITGFVAGVPVGTAATWVGPVTAQSGTQPSAVISGSTLTAGKMEWFIEYVIQ